MSTNFYLNDTATAREAFNHLAEKMHVTFRTGCGVVRYGKNQVTIVVDGWSVEKVAEVSGAIDAINYLTK
jgi:hypothetical protein